MKTQRRHHLIEEAKAELDVAYDEVKRAENKIMQLEQDYNNKTKEMAIAGAGADSGGMQDLMAEKEALQEGLNLGFLYTLQSTAIERFAMITSAFTIVWAVEDDSVCVDLIRNILFRKAEIQDAKVKIDGTIREFTSGLRAYTRESADSENDMRVRNAWAELEELLRGFGRNI